MDMSSCRFAHGTDFVTLKWIIQTGEHIGTVAPICDIYPAQDIGVGQEPESQSRIDLWFEKHVAFEMRPYPADIQKWGDLEVQEIPENF